MLDLEAGAAEVDLALHHHVVAEAGGLEETRPRLDQRIAGEVERFNCCSLVSPSARSNSAATEASKISK